MWMTDLFIFKYKEDKNMFTFFNTLSQTDQVIIYIKPKAFAMYIYIFIFESHSDVWTNIFYFSRFLVSDRILILTFTAGFYLFLQVQFPLSLASIKYKHFLMFGWGK